MNISDILVDATVLSPLTNVLSQSLALRHSTLKHSTHEHTKEVHFSPTASPYLGNMPLSGPPSATDSEDDDTNSASLRIGVLIHRALDGYAMRANNLQSFLALNRHVRLSRIYYLERDTDTYEYSSWQMQLIHYLLIIRTVR